MDAHKDAKDKVPGSWESDDDDKPYQAWDLESWGHPKYDPDACDRGSSSSSSSYSGRRRS